LAEIERALKTFGIERSAETTKRSPSMFRAIRVFKLLDYDLKENEKRLEWGLKVMWSGLWRLGLKMPER